MSSQIKILSNKFNTLLSQYQETYQEFLNAIDSNNNNFTTLPMSSFVSQSNLNTIENTSVDNCLSSCATNESCSGATFDDNLNVCTLSSGPGEIIHSNNKIAIVKKALYYSNQLKQLNNELLMLNNLMIQNSNLSANIYSQTQNINNEKANILKNNYTTLEREREQIEVIIREYETLNSAYEDVNISVKSNYYVYIVYLLIAIFLFLLFTRITTTENQVGGGNRNVSPLLLIFLSAVIILNAYLHP